MPMGKGKNNDGMEGTQMSILPSGVPPSTGSTNDDDFHHALFSVLFSFNLDLLKVPIVYSCFWCHYNCLEYECCVFTGCSHIWLYDYWILFIRNFSDYYLFYCALCLAFLSKKSTKQKIKGDEEGWFSCQW